MSRNNNFTVPFLQSYFTKNNPIDEAFRLDELEYQNLQLVVELLAQLKHYKLLTIPLGLARTINTALKFHIPNVLEALESRLIPC